MTDGKIVLSKRKIELNLNTAEGCPVNLVGVCKKISEQIGLSKQREKEILAEMLSGDYETIIDVMNREFGNYLILFR